MGFIIFEDECAERGVGRAAVAGSFDGTDGFNVGDGLDWGGFEVDFEELDLALVEVVVVAAN